MSNRVKRHRSRTFVLEGVQPITRALAHGWTFEAVIHESGAPLSDWATDVIARADAAVRYEMTPELLGAAQREDRHVGTAGRGANARRVVRADPDPRKPAGRRDGSAREPGNLGTLIRSCDALGASGLVVTGHAVDLYDPATITASRGSIFALPVVQAASHAEVLQWVASVRERLGRCDLVGTDERADTDLAAHDFTAPTVLVVGNETHGLSRAYRDACDAVVRIPMSGSASSLNVSVAASIAIYEVVRQRAGHFVPSSRGLAVPLQRRDKLRADCSVTVEDTRGLGEASVEHWRTRCLRSALSAPAQTPQRPGSGELRSVLRRRRQVAARRRRHPGRPARWRAGLLRDDRPKTVGSDRPARLPSAV